METARCGWTGRAESALGLRYYTFVSQVESGVGRAPVEMQAAWAEALGLDPGEFARTLLRHYEPELHRLLFLTTKGESSGARASGGKG